ASCANCRLPNRHALYGIPTGDAACAARPSVRESEPAGMRAAPASTWLRNAVKHVLHPVRQWLQTTQKSGASIDAPLRVESGAYRSTALSALVRRAPICAFHG